MLSLSLTAAVLGSTALALPSSQSRRQAQPVEYLGRVDPATLELTWPATGIRFTFDGQAPQIPIASQTGSNALQIIVDGGEPVIIDNVNTTSISIAGDYGNGTHIAEIRRKNEYIYGSIFLGDLTTEGLSAPSAVPTRRIEIVGDSISVGYGEDGLLPCTNSAALEDGPNTYGALTANNLSADYSIVAWSGKGILRNYCVQPPDGQPLMTELWTQYGADDAENSYDFATPVDVVVINLGTNDFGYLDCRDPINVTDYTNAVVSFSQTVQTKYPGVEIFLTSSPMLSDTYPTAEDAQHTTQSNALKDAASQIGANAHFVDFPPQGSVVGCDYHPVKATHEQMAAILTDAISSVLGW